MELNIDKALHQAVIAHKAGNLQEAERCYRVVLQSHAKHPEANHNLGLIAISFNQTAKALLLFKTALDVNPMKEQFWISYIDTLIKCNNLKGAKQSIKQAKKKGFFSKKLKALLLQVNSSGDKQLPSNEQLGKLLEQYQKGQYDLAEKLARSLSIQFPRHNFSFKILGAVLKKTGEVTEALFAMQKAVEMAPDDAEAHFNLGNMLKDLGRLEEAESSQRQAIALKPDFADAFNNLGVTLKELGRLEEAEVSYTRALELKPHLEGALRNRWRLLFDKKDYEGALKYADLVISKGAGQLDLTTLYALGRIEEIYKRIELQSEVDSENISIAAFASFIAEAENRETSYNFCPKPLDFIHVANISTHVKNLDAFVAGIVDELSRVKTTWEPQGKSTAIGFQSRGHLNFFGKKSKYLVELKSIIIDELESYKLKFKNELCSYIEKWPSANYLSGWHVILKHQGYQRPHIHAGGWLSGVIYLKVVPSLDKHEGATKFSLNGPDYNMLSSPSFLFEPDEGDIVLFPSSLHHQTIPFTTHMDRIIISFDLLPK